MSRSAFFGFVAFVNFSELSLLLVAEGLVGVGVLFVETFHGEFVGAFHYGKQRLYPRGIKPDH